ncbi:MAG: hypothetical protein EPN82_13730 [Bacteroidetes bacterium]|nr:MAG: hypothetical protein EPN82_13730 [Bacteroidota bacterium]
MISIEKDNVTIPRKTWDKLRRNHYYNELIENLLDSEELIEAINKTDGLIDLRDYDRKRRATKIHNTDK